MAENTGKSLSRALTRPVRAMSRMLAGHATAPGDATPHQTGSGIVNCALYLDGVRQPGEWHYAEALSAARAHTATGDHGADDRARTGFVWLGIKEPGANELADVAETFELHELAVEDAVKSSQRPKVERYEDMTFLTMRTARYVEHGQLTANSEVVEVGDILMFLGEHFVITVRHGNACELSPVRKKLEERPDLLALGPWAVAYAVYDRVVDLFVDVAAAMEEDVAAVEDSVFSRSMAGTGRIQQIYQLKRELMEFKRTVLPLQRPLTGLVAGQFAKLPAEIERYFRDVLDHLARTVEQVMYFDDVLNSILQARLAQVTVDQNNDMRKIAAWAGLAAVWTAIAGVYGMNFEVMPEIGWTFGYPVVLAIMVGVSIALYRAFRRSGWL
jgi:magnesium transporter